MIEIQIPYMVFSTGKGLQLGGRSQHRTTLCQKLTLGIYRLKNAKTEIYYLQRTTLWWREKGPVYLVL